MSPHKGPEDVSRDDVYRRDVRSFEQSSFIDTKYQCVKVLIGTTYIQSKGMVAQRSANLCNLKNGSYNGKI